MNGSGGPAALTPDDGGPEPGSGEPARIYWHRELPPATAEIVGEHVLEAVSRRVRGSLALRGELWDRCFVDLMDNTHDRLLQELDRLGGDYAHVLHESIDSRHDDTTGEAWLRGRFRYMLYRRPRRQPSSRPT